MLQATPCALHTHMAYSKKQHPWRTLTASALISLRTRLIGLWSAVFFGCAISSGPRHQFLCLTRQVDQSTKIYDRTGQVLLYDYTIGTRKRDIIPLAAISPNTIQATIAIEDSSFYEHGGIRFTSIVRAMLADVIGGALSQGGSTITQQVVKNTLLTNQKSVIRKIHEWVLAIKLEQTYSKDQILEVYLNNIPYGGTLYGIEAAAESYFGIPAKDLTLAESAYLASMIRAPSYYSPYGSHRVRTRCTQKLGSREDAYARLLPDARRIRARGRSGSPSRRQGIRPLSLPHFVFYILNQLETSYGTKALASGLKVTTTLDADLQVKAESIINRYALQNVKKFRASNASLVAMSIR